MARKKAGKQRIEPRFDDGSSSGHEVRATSKDRSAGPQKGKSRRASPAKKKSSTARSGNGSGGNGRRPAGRKKKSAASGSWIARTIKRTVYWSAVLGIWGVVAVVGILGYYAAYLPPTSEWQVPKRPPNVKIVFANGELMANRGDTGGEAVRLEQLPSYLPNAVIAIEDRRFRSHFGADPIGLFRAVVTNLTSGRLRQGGSTLTQQLAKNLFLKPDRTLKRKMQELVLAIWLETKFSKDQILEMYLNRVYFGSGAYGVDAAARRYFGKSARLVTIAEAATLAGLLKAPSRYSPAKNPDLAEERAQVVLAAMHDEGYITADEAKNALASPAKVVRRHTTASENYVADWVMEQLPDFVGSIDSDIIVDTTVDKSMQQAAETSLRQALRENGTKYKVSQGAIVTLDTAGAVKALVGGADYGKSQYNRAVYAKRQPGSSFKPFVYLTALEKGLTPNTIRQDHAVTYNGWSPQNYTKKHYGNVTLTQGLAMSLNTIAAQLAYEVGPKAVAKTAHRLGITSDLKPNLSLALGTSEVTPLEIASAYVPFSNGGYGVLPHVIRRIKSQDGTIIYSRNGGGPGRVVDRQYVGEMNQMMMQTLMTGTGKKARLNDGRPAGGKTGTSQDFRDGWFIGYTGNLTTAVWLGNDDNSKTNKATGGSLPAEVWKTVMDKEHDGLPVVDLPGVPGGVMMASDGQVPVPPQNVGSGSAVIPPEPIGGGGGPLKLLKSLFGG